MAIQYLKYRQEVNETAAPKFQGSQWHPTTTDICEPGNRGPLFERTAVALLILSFITLGLRLYTRGVLIRHIGLDDWLCLAAAVVSIGMVVTFGLAVSHDMGKHQCSKTVRSVTIGLQLSWGYSLFYSIAVGLVKLSILALYARIAPTRRYKMVVYGIAAVVIAQMVQKEFGFIFACKPISNFWLSHKEEGCINILHFIQFNAAFNIFVDLLIYILPIPVVRKLQINPRKKISIYVIISLGFIPVIASALRLYAIVIWARSSDMLWNWPLVLIWGNIEVSVAITVASFPSLTALIRKTMGNVLGTTATPIGSTPQNRASNSFAMLSAMAGRERSGHTTNMSTIIKSDRHDMDEDTESQEDILSEQKKGSQGITVTKSLQYSVTHQDV
ncbi:MAG: hypothetical protein M1813_002109 [Trichoglossum hirsutum]|nr:MAG: hypothetical protein M1813_002109 [Trichoglossum hirsutum]